MTTSQTATGDDRALLQAIADGDKDALRQLYDRHSGVLFALALKVLNNRTDAEDVLQETFVSGLENCRRATMSAAANRLVG